MKKVEKTAKNLDEALRQAAIELGADKKELSYEILQEVGKGLLGFLVGKEITISAWLKKDETEQIKAVPIKQEKVSEKHSKPAVQSVASKTFNNKPQKSASAARVSKGEPPVSKNKTHAEAESVPHSSSVNVSDKNHDGANKNPTQKSSRAPSNIDDKKLDEIKGFLSELLTKMGISHQLKITVNNDVINVNVLGEKMGFLIGKRGETLDAVQYLTSLFINKGKEGYVKVSIDTESYRQKREETLVRLAHGLERRVMSSKRPVTLEPMSPYERRVIHAALQNNPRIRTYSVGDEPNRKIVVTPS